MEASNFEQEFMQNVKIPAEKIAPPRRKDLKLLTIIILAVFLLIESVILTIALVRYFNLANEGRVDDTVSSYDSQAEENYKVDDDGELTAFELVCSSDNGEKFLFAKSNKYVLYNANAVAMESGEYSIKNTSLVSIKSGNDSASRVLYYDGYDVADGLTLYHCEETDDKATKE